MRTQDDESEIITYYCRRNADGQVLERHARLRAPAWLRYAVYVLLTTVPGNSPDVAPVTVGEVQTLR